ncbi:MAG: flagellar hook capping FlgD N-terminal domain-containing protein [Phycisphaerales bacterium JB039]
MDFDATAGIGAAQQQVPNAFGALTSEQFVEIMMTEMQGHDPLEPNDSQALLDQISSIRSIQSDIDLADKLESIVLQGQLSSASSLIGKYIGGYDGAREAQGYVLSVSRTADGPVLNLDSGQRVRMDDVFEMLDPATLLGGAP